MENLSITEDHLGQGFKDIVIPLADDFDGPQEATLIFRKASNANKKAILYVHGFIDYFFQTEMADIYNDWGFDFYAVDLRKYGRSLKEYQHPNFISDIHDYFEELDKSIAIIKESGVKEILLMGHSTGGLTTPLYAQYRKNIDGLILNSPFFDFNVSVGLKTLLPLIAAVGKIIPFAKMDSLSENYPKSLHKNYLGEWDFNEEWKPIKNFPAYMGWTRAIYKAQKELQKGLDIQCPVLVLHSDKSYIGKNWNELIRTSDAVLNIDHMKKYAPGLGNNIKIVEIKDGVHDLTLSVKESRDNTFKQIKQWLDKEHL